MEFKFVFLSNENQNKFINILSMIKDAFLSYNFDNYSFITLKKNLDIKDDVSFIMCINEVPIGIFLGSMRGEIAYIPTMIIFEGFRGNGYGRIMLQKGLSLFSEKNCDKVILEVLQENTKAIDLYKSEGFSICNEIFNYQNNYNSFFTKKRNLYPIEKSDGFIFHAIYKNFHKTKRPWAKELRSLLLIIDSKEGELYLIKNSNKILGYAVIIRSNNFLKIVDIYLEKDNISLFDEFLSSLLVEEKITQIRSLYRNDVLTHLIMKSNFFVKIKQFEMIKKIIS